jgi:AraC-like DNA-binding protein
MRETGGATDLDEIAETLFIGKDYLRHLVTRQTGRSPLKHLIELRMTRAAKLLRERNCGVAEAAKDCGFPDVYYFSRLFKKSFGASPAAYRDAEAGKCKKATRKSIQIIERIAYNPPLEHYWRIS